jgi:hypothetical protein
MPVTSKIEMGILRDALEDVVFLLSRGDLDAAKGLANRALDERRKSDGHGDCIDGDYRFPV